MRILAVANQKGGCGKTTVAVNLASALSEQGKRVLLIDMDPQAHATTSMGIDPSEVKHNLYDVLTASEANKATLDMVTQRIKDNLYLAPSALFLSAIEQELAGVAGREEQLLKAIRGLNQSFRYVILDCPPSLGLLTFNALRAAKEILIPVEPSSYSLRGIDLLLESLELLESVGGGGEMRVYALANNFSPRTRFGKAVQDELQERFGNQLMETVITPCTRLKEAAAMGKPVNLLPRNNAATRAFKALAWEIIDMEENPKIVGLERAMELIRPSRQVATGEVLFSISDQKASTVHVVGDFNNWTPNQEARLELGNDGLYSTRIKLDPGIYQYRFIVDGRWQEDPGNPRTAPAPFGGMNSVLEIADSMPTEEIASS